MAPAQSTRLGRSHFDADYRKCVDVYTPSRRSDLAVVFVADGIYCRIWTHNDCHYHSDRTAGRRTHSARLGLEATHHCGGKPGDHRNGRSHDGPEYVFTGFCTIRYGCWRDGSWFHFGEHEYYVAALVGIVG